MSIKVSQSSHTIDVIVNVLADNLLTKDIKLNGNY